MEQSKCLSVVLKQNTRYRQKEYSLNTIGNLSKKLKNLSRNTGVEYKDKNKQCTVLFNTATYEVLNKLIIPLMTPKSVTVIRKTDVTEAGRTIVEEQLYLEIRGRTPPYKICITKYHTSSLMLIQNYGTRSWNQGEKETNMSHFVEEILKPIINMIENDEHYTEFLKYTTQVIEETMKEKKRGHPHINLTKDITNAIEDNDSVASEPLANNIAAVVREMGTGTHNEDGGRSGVLVNNPDPNSGSKKVLVNEALISNQPDDSQFVVPACDYTSPACSFSAVRNPSSKSEDGSKEPYKTTKKTDTGAKESGVQTRKQGVNVEELMTKGEKKKCISTTKSDSSDSNDDMGGADEGSRVSQLQKVIAQTQMMPWVGHMRGEGRG